MIRSAPAGHNSGTPAAQNLRAFMERIERLTEERKSIADDIADIFKELEGAGYDKHAAKIVLKIRQSADGLAAYTDRTDTVDVYLAALGMLPDRAGARAHGIIEEFPAPPTPAAHGGGLGVPSSVDGGAKMDGAIPPILEPVADEARFTNTETEQAADQFEPPAFLRKEKNERCQLIRPDCRFREDAHKATCATCTSAWQIAQRKAGAA